MAFSNTYQPTAPQPHLGQGSAILNREDLTDILTILAPEETPILSLCSKSKAKSTFVEWGVDKLAAPQNTPVSEGADVQSFDDKFAAQARLGNYVQKFRRAYLVSDLQEAVDSLGPNKIARAEMKAMQEIKRDMELVISSDADRVAQDGANAYQMRGLGTWLQSAGPADVPAAYRTPAGSILTQAPTEPTFNNQLASIFGVNGKINRLTLVAGTALRRTISDFTRTDNNAGEQVYRVNQDAESKKVTLAVNMYDSDFGLVAIVNANPACVVNSNRGYLINPDYIGVSSLIPLQSKRLENQGGGERGYCDATLTLICKHPGAHGKIAY